MFTWILLAIIVAALFGLIDFEKVRHWLLEHGKKLWPYAKKYAQMAQENLKNVEKRLEEKHHKQNFDKPKETPQRK